MCDILYEYILPFTRYLHPRKGFALLEPGKLLGVSHTYTAIFSFAAAVYIEILLSGLWALEHLGCSEKAHQRIGSPVLSEVNGC